MKSAFLQEPLSYCSFDTHIFCDQNCSKALSSDVFYNTVKTRSYIQYTVCSLSVVLILISISPLAMMQDAKKNPAKGAVDESPGCKEASECCDGETFVLSLDRRDSQ